MNTHWLSNCFPVSIDKAPAPPPKPYPFGPYLRPWQFLQNNSLSCSVQFVESNILLHISIEFPNGPKMRSLNFILFRLQIGLQIAKRECSLWCIRGLAIYTPFELLTALEAWFVEFITASNTFFGCVYGFTAFWAFWIISWDERHCMRLYYKIKGPKKNQINEYYEFFFRIPSKFQQTLEWLIFLFINHKKSTKIFTKRVWLCACVPT